MKDSILFKKTKMAEGVTLIVGPGLVFCYLVEGKDHALLIDTLCGIGSLAEFCKEITSLPIIVVNTHGHVDHTGGNFEFNEVFIHPEDIDDMYGMSTKAEREEFVRSQQKKVNEPMEWSPADVVDVKQIRCLPLYEGQIFDLGGRILEVVETPGHSRGSVCFLDRENRQMFAGDTVNRNTLICPPAPTPTTIEEFLVSLHKLKKLQEAFDTFYICHGESTIDKSCIDDAIECCEQIMAGTDDSVPGVMFGQHIYYAKQKDAFFRRLDGRIGNVAYHKDNIFLRE